MTEVSFTMEITLRGLDGTPGHGEREGSAKRKKKHPEETTFRWYFPSCDCQLAVLADACWVTLSDADCQTLTVRRRLFCQSRRGNRICKHQLTAHSNSVTSMSRDAPDDDWQPKLPHFITKSSFHTKKIRNPRSRSQMTVTGFRAEGRTSRLK